MTRHASELENHPLFQTRKGAEAINIGHIYSEIYGSRYVTEKVAKLERISTAKDGEARKESIAMVDAGGNLPSEYYTPEGKRSFSVLSVAEEGQ